MERRFLVTSVFITLGAVAFLSGYLLVPRGNLNQQKGVFIERFSSKTDGTLTDNKIDSIVPISSRKFISFVNLAHRPEVIVAVDKEGNIVEIDTDRFSERVVGTLKHNNIVEVTLSPYGSSLVYSFYNSRNAKRHAYFDTKKGEVEMPDDFKSGSFSSDGSQLVYLVSKDTGGELLVSKGTDTTKQILKTRINTGVVNWPINNISITGYGEGGYGDSFILKEEGFLNKVISYKYGLDVNWSPSGNNLIFSYKDSGGLDRLFSKNIASVSDEVDLKIATNASKCGWLDKNSVICGVTNRTNTKDEFYEIDISDGSKVVVSIPNINILTKEVSASRSRDYILVLNKIDSGLYALKLKEPR